MIRVVAADESHVWPLVKNMRAVDQAECYYTTGHVEHAETNVEGINAKNGRAWAIFADDTLLCICGIVKHPFYNVVWALGTNAINDHKLAFYRETKKLIMLNRDNNPMVNFVHESNVNAKAYLERLGFILEAPKPYGKLKKYFHHFKMDGI